MLVDWWAGMEVCRGFGHPYEFTWGNLNNFKSIESLSKDHCDITLKSDFTGVKKCILLLFASSKIALTVQQSRQFGWYFQFSSLCSAKLFRQASILRRQSFSFKFWFGKSQHTWSFEGYIKIHLSSSSRRLVLWAGAVSLDCSFVLCLMTSNFLLTS